MSHKEHANILCSVILPCRNEEHSLGVCITGIQKVFQEHGIRGEVIVSDSSNDRSPEIARKHAVMLIKHDREGYGQAYRMAFPHASGKCIICMDADGTYDHEAIPEFLRAVQRGSDMVIGNRFAGVMHDGAMPWLHRYVGNPFLSWMMRVLFRSNIRDAHCGMRAISRDALKKVSFQTTGMEFASEMILVALQHKLCITEIPINYYSRLGESKLRTFRDGWRHIRFMLLYSPRYLFLFPGIVFFVVGAASMVWLYARDPVVWGIQFYFHPLFVSSALIVIGYQLIFFALFAYTYTSLHLSRAHSALESFYRVFTLEKGIFLAVVLGVLGFAFFASILTDWIRSDFGAMQQVESAIIALTLVIVAIQTLFSSFMISVLGIHIDKHV